MKDGLMDANECRDYLGLMMILTAACGPRHQEHSNDHT